MKVNTLALALFASLTSAQNFDICRYFGIPDWVCDICGGYGGSAPIVCSPFNATYDELTVNKPVGTYYSAKWTNFETTKALSLPGGLPLSPGTLKAYSPRNYAKVPAGKTGNITFVTGYDGVEPRGAFPFAVLVSYHYGCALPFTPIPTACDVKVKSLCVAENFNFNGPNQTFEYTIQYRPKLGNGTLAFHKGDPASATGNGIYCYSYSFQATGKGGIGKVDFVVDDVIGRGLRQRFA